MADLAYMVAVAIGAAIAFLLCYSLAFYAVRGIVERIRGRQDRNTKWMPNTRDVGNQTWVVVQLIRYGVLGERIIAEQLVAVISRKHSEYDDQVQKRQRLAELRAAWLNDGMPRNPKM